MTPVALQRRSRLGMVVAALGASLAVACGGSGARPKEAPLVADPPLGAEDGGAAGAGRTEVQRAAAYVENEKWAEARAHVEKALAASPSSVEAHFYLGVIEEKSGTKEAAVAAYRAALGADAGFAPAAQNLSALYLDEPARPDEAVAVLEAALAKNPDEVALRQNLAYAYGLKGDVDKASKHYQAALAKGDDPAIRFAFGSLLFEAKRFEAAAAELEKALAGTKDDAPMLATLGHMLSQAKAPKACVAAFDRALALQKNDAAWLVRRGGCRNDLGDAAGAQADFEAAIAADPKLAAPHYFFAQLLLSQKKRTHAMGELEKAAILGGATPIGKAAKDKLAEVRKGGN